MTRRTRLFVMISGGALVAGLGTGLVASYMGAGLQSLTIIGTDGPAELAYLPPDAGLVAFADVRQVMDSQLRQKLLQMRPDSSGRPSDFETRTGINVETDVDLVVAAFAEGGAERDRVLVLARGRFDPVRIEGLVREQGGGVEVYNGARLLTVEDDGEWAVAFVEPDLAAIGEAAAVRRAIDTGAGGDSVTSNDELMELIRDVDESHTWAVGRFDEVARGGRLPQELAGQLPPITWFAATGSVNGGIAGQLRAEATTEDAATDLREVVRGFVALARLQARQNDELAALLNALQLGGDGRTVSLGFSISPEMIDALSGLQRQAEPEVVR